VPLGKDDCPLRSEQHARSANGAAAAVRSAIRCATWDYRAIYRSVARPSRWPAIFSRAWHDRPPDRAGSGVSRARSTLPRRHSRRVSDGRPRDAADNRALASCRKRRERCTKRVLRIGNVTSTASRSDSHFHFFHAKLSDPRASGLICNLTSIGFSIALIAPMPRAHVVRTRPRVRACPYVLIVETQLTIEGRRGESVLRDEFASRGISRRARSVARFRVDDETIRRCGREEEARVSIGSRGCVLEVTEMDENKAIAPPTKSEQNRSRCNCRSLEVEGIVETIIEARRDGVCSMQFYPVLPYL
jgi:hypothetical protein